MVFNNIMSFYHKPLHSAVKLRSEEMKSEEEHSFHGANFDPWMTQTSMVIISLLLQPRHGLLIQL